MHDDYYHSEHVTFLKVPYGSNFILKAVEKPLAKDSKKTNLGSLAASLKISRSPCTREWSKVYAGPAGCASFLYLLSTQLSSSRFPPISLRCKTQVTWPAQSYLEALIRTSRLSRTSPKRRRRIELDRRDAHSTYAYAMLSVCNSRHGADLL